ncbi:hypothetical protein [Parasphingorhabdus cellanae]|uniref:Uncharacterized protein n=1 Tax=Parasphingorhabdus cellanae TaxID=2806553 RepID=A0ABX7T642_9SPHN|nr:hypothetical protein [Parasphingorhabdus cellanae]QTD57053.1 hypothetical protein J4G78_05700 [Parasphingorhabdus cellanae]
MGIWSGNLKKLMTPLPDLMSLPSAEARIIMALRVAVMSQKCYQDARPYLRDRLGSHLAMSRFLILVEAVGFAWPESLTISRPCCPHTLPDEILLLRMFRHAAAGNRPGFDALICEMIDPDSRNRVYLDMANFASVYGAHALKSKQ